MAKGDYGVNSPWIVAALCVLGAAVMECGRFGSFGVAMGRICAFISLLSCSMFAHAVPFLIVSQAASSFESGRHGPAVLP